MYNRNLCLIPAKAVSSRLPFKNVLKIKKKELIFFGIDAAIKSKLFGKHVYVSTESEQIKKVAEKYGAQVPFLRNKKLSFDPAGVVDVALDFLEKISDLKMFRNLFIILPTSPMINSKDIVMAYSIFTRSGCNSLMSVSETEHNARRSIHVKKNKIVPLFKNDIKKKSQELEKTYYINGAIAIINIKSFLINKTYFIYPMAAFVLPRERGVDIDNPIDYKWAKFLMERNEK